MGDNQPEVEIIQGDEHGPQNNDGSDNESQVSVSTAHSHSDTESEVSAVSQASAHNHPEDGHQPGHRRHKHHLNIKSPFGYTSFPESGTSFDAWMETIAALFEVGRVSPKEQYNTVIALLAKNHMELVREIDRKAVNTIDKLLDHVRQRLCPAAKLMSNRVALSRCRQRESDTVTEYTTAIRTANPIIRRRRDRGGRWWHRRRVQVVIDVLGLSHLHAPDVPIDDRRRALHTTPVFNAEQIIQHTIGRPSVGGRYGNGGARR